MKMPASPSKHWKAPNQHNSPDPSQLQIRIVPYSPPRLSTDGPAPSCPVSHAAHPSSALPQSQDQVHHVDHAVAYNSNLRLEPNCPLPLGKGLECRGPVNSDVAAKFADATNPNSSPTEEVPAPIAPASPSPSYCRANKVIAVNSDKTFSLLPQPYPRSFATNSTPSPRRSSIGPSSSRKGTVSETFATEQPSSALSTPLEASQPCSEDRTAFPRNRQFGEPSSPWDFQLTGGLRKVPRSASPKTVHVSRDAAFLATSCPGHDLTASGSSPSGPSQAGNPVFRQPLHFSPSVSTLSETDYKTLTHDSPCPKQAKHLVNFDTFDSEQMSASPTQPNFEVLGESSSEPSSGDQSRPRTSDSNCNYVLHQESTSSSPVAQILASQLKTEYSRESLVVAPLRPARRQLTNQTSLSCQRSRDSVRAGSWTSTSSAASVQRFAADTPVSSPSAVTRQTSTCRGIPINSGNEGVEAAHHQWNTTLSTVGSKSERGSEVSSSRLSHTMLGEPGRECASHTASLVVDLDVWHSESCIDRPQPAYFKHWTVETNSSSLRLIGDQDEHGDGLAELRALHRHPSRTRLHSYLSNIPSDRNLRSASSSHSNSFSRSYIPTWARLYYGGGERRLLSLRQSSESLYSNFATCAHHRPTTSHSASFQISNLAKRACHQRHISASIVSRSPTTSNAPSHNGGPIPYSQLSMIRRIRKQTSSLWSPHLCRDKRSQMHSIWRPPSSGFVARENKIFQGRIQLVLFVLGFVFPFAWMAASFLPLPSRHDLEFGEKVHSTSHLDLEQGTNVLKEIGVRAHRHDREKWWRTLNRYMSIVGVFVIGAVLALTITGIQQQWKP
ncbi:hypothetical protein E4U21_003425 [Claviceps maximensis]|nr:hypothetical protein E4U21_003425 [Claviceps maximensis]